MQGARQGTKQDLGHSVRSELCWWCSHALSGPVLGAHSQRSAALHPPKSRSSSGSWACCSSLAVCCATPASSSRSCSVGAPHSLSRGLAAAHAASGAPLPQLPADLDGAATVAAAAAPFLVGSAGRAPQGKSVKGPTRQHRRHGAQRMPRCRAERAALLQRQGGKRPPHGTHTSCTARTAKHKQLRCSAARNHGCFKGIHAA